MKKFFLFLFCVALVAGFVGCSKNKTVYNLRQINQELTQKVSNLEKQVKDLNDQVGSLARENFDDEQRLEHQIHLRDELLLRLSLRVSISTIQSQIAQIALFGDGRQDIDELSYVFYVVGEATSDWSNAEVKRFKKINNFPQEANITFVSRRR